MQNEELESWLGGPEAVGPTGPDYVTLVIEWDELPDAEDAAVEELTDRMLEGRRPGRAIAAALVGLGALLLAGWGLHRLRSA